MMKNKFLPLAAMVLFLGISWGFDAAKYALRNYRARTFHMTTLWIDLLIELVLAGLVILFVWLVLFKFNKSALVPWVFIPLGLLGLYLSAPYALLFPHLNLFNNVEIPFRYLRVDYPFYMRLYFDFVLFTRSFPLFGIGNLGGVFANSSALTLAVGVASLLRKAH